MCKKLHFFWHFFRKKAYFLGNEHFLAKIWQIYGTYAGLGLCTKIAIFFNFWGKMAHLLGFWDILGKIMAHMRRSIWTHMCTKIAIFFNFWQVFSTKCIADVKKMSIFCNFLAGPFLGWDLTILPFLTDFQYSLYWKVQKNASFCAQHLSQMWALLSHKNGQKRSK